MTNEELKKDFESTFKKLIDPINQKMIEQEKTKHDEFLKKHFEKYDRLHDRDLASIYQLITLGGVIFTAIIIFNKPDNATLWLTLAICSILVSLFFGVWLLYISIQAGYQSHENDYLQEMRHHWWTRELWKDNSVKTEKEITEPHLKEEEERHDYKKKFTYKALKFLHLNADRVENIFRLTLLLAFFFLILHFFNAQHNKSKSKNEIHHYIHKFAR
jgi:hypothetical protein